MKYYRLAEREQPLKVRLTQKHSPETPSMSHKKSGIENAYEWNQWILGWDSHAKV